MKKSPAKRAVRTRQARDRLFHKYGCMTYDVLQALARGKDPTDLLWSLTYESLAAYKANLTRGTYDDLLNDCNF